MRSRKIDSKETEVVLIHRSLERPASVTVYDGLGKGFRAAAVPVIAKKGKGTTIGVFLCFKATPESPDLHLSPMATNLFDSYRACEMLKRVWRLRFDAQGRCITLMHLTTALSGGLKKKSLLGELATDFDMGLRKFTNFLEGWRKRIISGKHLLAMPAA